MIELSPDIVKARHCKRCLYYFYTHGARPEEYREHGHPPWHTHFVYHFCDKGIPGIEPPTCKFCNYKDWYANL
jgi:hypothetical protein